MFSNGNIVFIIDYLFDLLLIFVESIIFPLLALKNLKQRIDCSSLHSIADRKKSDRFSKNFQSQKYNEHVFIFNRRSKIDDPISE